ncbi:hypothetical protein FLA_5772 [Filimonas lacunae]|nr:hypothetical protein FLA_5772 [Filimonas lacunae]
MKLDSIKADFRVYLPVYKAVEIYPKWTEAGYFVAFGLIFA